MIKHTNRFQPRAFKAWFRDDTLGVIAISAQVLIVLIALAFI